jgi:hypothetical protein
MVADRPYGEFYDFYVSPEYFGYSLVYDMNTVNTVNTVDLATGSTEYDFIKHVRKIANSGY